MPPAPELTAREEPRYGYFAHWPEDGDAWLHPEDVELARTLIPSDRVFRRERAEDDEFDRLVYGDKAIRVKPALWNEVQGEGYEIGQWVEVLSRGMKNTPQTAVIREIHWDHKQRALRYQIRHNEDLVPNFYAAEDLRPVETTPEAAEPVVIEPSGEAEELA
ncbi:DUF6960 family protein [Adhaeretor mobilis]|uniref:Uncharacterized protein n=1 Tax=Adhaeretor mobilis TaxID=1930276 RepID=A0A517MT31_9BACT|nr:hypothetical protein [Adhaeretor mobilis]QDS98043.1 hypothetical protein HG15A2_13130 [Adhaeretor mobilis]